MWAIEVTAHGGPEVLEHRQISDPEPGPGEVLVATRAVGVNFIDTYLREGMYPSNPPYVPGSEGAGDIVAVGSGVDPSRIGERVAWADAPASYAELVRVRAPRAVHLPDDVSYEQAAGVMLRGMTAHYLLDGSAHPSEGDTVLLHAGAGGVGLLLTQMARDKGIRVITTVSTDEKERLSRQAGAAEVLRYSPDLAERVRDLTASDGVAVAYDGVGASTFEASLAATRVRGMIVLFGAASGPVPPFDLQRLNPAGSLSVTRPTLGHFIASDEELNWRAGEVLGAVAEGRLQVDVSATYPLARAADAQTDLAARKTTGSTVLTVAGSDGAVARQ